MLTSWKKVQKKHELHNIKFENYFANIGRSFFDILNLIGISKNHKEIEKTYQNESIKNLKKINYYKSVIQTLRLLKANKFILNIVTSKDINRTEILLKNNLKLFTFINCHNLNSKGKPNPYMINEIISKLKANKSDCVYIGDTHIDYLSAKNAKIDFIYAQWGYGKDYNYKYKCKTISELYRYIDYNNN